MYVYLYNGVKIQISRCGDIGEPTYKRWAAVFSGGKFGADVIYPQDTMDTKKYCLECAKLFVDNSEYHNGYGWCYTGE